MTSPASSPSPVRVVLVSPLRGGPDGAEVALKACGCDVATAASMGEASRLLASYHPELIVVLAEAVSPVGGDGLYELRTAARGVPMVLLGAADTSHEILERSSRSCFDDFLLLPLVRGQMQARVAAVREEAPQAAFAARKKAKVILFISSAAGLTRSVGMALELSGYHLLYRANLLDPIPVKPDLVMLTDEQVKYATTEVVCRALDRHGLAGVPVFLLVQAGQSLPAAGGCVTFLAAEAAPEETLRQVNQVFQRGAVRVYSETRKSFSCPVEVREAGTTAGWTSALAYEACGGGIFLRTIAPHRAGAAVELRIHVGGAHEAVQGTGVVAWANPFSARREVTYPVGMGVEFLGVSPERLTRLRELWRTAA